MTAHNKRVSSSLSRFFLPESYRIRVGVGCLGRDRNDPAARAKHYTK